MAKLVRAMPALAVVGLTMCREAPTAGSGTLDRQLTRQNNAAAAQIFRVDFDELNGSGVKARATLQMNGGDLMVTLEATGRVPEHVHPQHIHGFAAQTSTCPTLANDTNGDGVISFAEGSPSFGPVQIDLQPYPTPTNSAGATTYRMTFIASQIPFSVSDLTQKTMVLHGDFVGGSYVASLPVACGRVEAVN
jgi:hypothetical protein